jgi:hypothetical protein
MQVEEEVEQVLLGNLTPTSNVGSAGGAGIRCNSNIWTGYLTSNLCWRRWRWILRNCAGTAGTGGTGGGGAGSGQLEQQEQQEQLILVVVVVGRRSKQDQTAGAGGSGIVIVKELNKASGSWPLSAQFRSQKQGTWPTSLLQLM